MVRWCFEWRNFGMLSGSRIALCVQSRNFCFCGIEYLVCDVEIVLTWTGSLKDCNLADCGCLDHSEGQF